MKRVLVCAAFLACGESVLAADCLPRSQLPASIANEIRANPRANPAKYVYQEFPGPSGMETAWLVGYAHENNRGLFINEAHFRPGKGKKFVKVLGANSGLVEIFVPYANKGPPPEPGMEGVRNKYWDYSGGYGDHLNWITESEKGLCGYLIEPVVGLEIRDRDPAWKEAGKGYRGHEMVLWASENAENYDYLIHYHFLDDGRMQFRVAATSQNLGRSEHVMHLHTGVWRLNIDAGGAGNNPNADTNDYARLLSYKERKGNVEPKAVLQSEPFSGGKEGYADWKPREFTMVAVGDNSLKNGRGTITEFWIQPAFKGVAHHEYTEAEETTDSDLKDERFFRHEFWVTRNRPTETSVQDIWRYTNGESIENSDVVVWTQTPLLHIHRNEDGKCSIATDKEFGCPKGGTWTGIALALHSPALEIMPRNIFDTTPFYPLPRN